MSVLNMLKLPSESQYFGVIASFEKLGSRHAFAVCEPLLKSFARLCSRCASTVIFHFLFASVRAPRRMSRNLSF
jgi:hypothetical protein